MLFIVLGRSLHPSGFTDLAKLPCPREHLGLESTPTLLHTQYCRYQASPQLHTLEGRDLAFSLLWSQDLTQCQVRNGLSITSVKGMKVLPLILIVNFLGTGTPIGYVCVSFMGPRRIINYIQTVPDLQWFKWQFSTSWWQESSTHSVEMALWSLNFIFSWASDMQCSLVMLGSGNSRSSRSALGSWG